MTAAEEAEKIVSRIEQWLLVRAEAREGRANVIDLQAMRDRVVDAIASALSKTK